VEADGFTPSLRMFHSPPYLNPYSNNMRSNATEKSALVNSQRSLLEAAPIVTSVPNPSPTVVIACMVIPAAQQPRGITFHRPLEKFALQPHELQPCGAYRVQRGSSIKGSLTLSPHSLHRQPYRHSPKQGDHRTKSEDVNIRTRSF